MAGSLALFILAGCASIAGQLQPADLQAPLANIQGPWWSVSTLLGFEQQGDQVTGKGVTAGTYRWTCKGKMTGRVFQGKQNESADIGFVVSPDGRTARYLITDGITTSEERFYRGLLGPSSAQSSLSIEPTLTGGYVFQLPVNAEGAAFFSPNGTGAVREVFGTLQYFRNAQGAIKPWITFIPLEPPRSAVSYEQLVPQPDPGALESQRRSIEFMTSVRRNSPFSKKRPASIDGKPCWWVLTPLWDYKSGQRLSEHILGELYYEDPDRGGMPSEAVWVATRTPEGAWRSDSWYLIDAPKITAYRGIVEKGQIVGVEAAEVQTPPLDPFLSVKERVVWEARWRTRMLLQARQKSLPVLLRDSKTPQLSDLAGRLEQTILDLSHESDLARDQAQKRTESSAFGAQEKREHQREISQIESQLQDPELAENLRASLGTRLGQLRGTVAALEQQRLASEAEVDQLREMAIVYRERIEILKPMVQAIREEAANRGK